MSYLSLLGAAATAKRRDAPSVEYVGEVTAVRYDGAVNVRVRGGTLYAVPALASYTPRVKGDIVIVRNTRSGWYVVGQTGIDVVAAAGTSTPPVNPPTTVTPTGSATWRDGQRRDISYAVQGDAGAHGANTGCWFYGPDLNTAVNVGTVTSVTVTLARSKDKHGKHGPTPVRAYTHVEPSAPAAPPARLAGPWVLGALELGEVDTFTLPAEAITSLKATGRGLLVYAGTADYIEFTKAGANSGAVRVVYV